jgi:hypothetical protein
MTNGGKPLMYGKSESHGLLPPTEETLTRLLAAEQVRRATRDRKGANE